MFEVRVKYSDRTEYIANGKLHREDAPALEYKNGTKEWYINGKRHREDGPACEYEDGTYLWYKKGIIIREVYV